MDLRYSNDRGYIFFDNGREDYTLHLLTREMVCLIVGCAGHNCVGKTPHHGGLGSTDGGVGENRDVLSVLRSKLSGSVW